MARDPIRGYPKRPGNPVFCDWKVGGKKKKKKKKRKKEEFQIEQFQPVVDHGSIWNKTTGDHGFETTGDTMAEKPIHSEREGQSVWNKSWPWDGTVLVKGSRTSQGSREKDLFGDSRTNCRKQRAFKKTAAAKTFFFFFFLIVRPKSFGV